MKLIKRMFGYCEHCNRWFVYPKKRKMSTAFEHEESNYINSCKNCYNEIEEYWKERWIEFYSSRL